MREGIWNDVSIKQVEQVFKPVSQLSFFRDGLRQLLKLKL